MREFSKLNYLSYDNFFVEIGAELFLKIFPKLDNFVFLEKLPKMSESTNIPILCIPNNDFICAKTNQISYIDILVNKQNKIHVHPNNIMKN